MNKGKIVMCGMHEAGWEMTKYLLENGIEISYIVTIPEDIAIKLSASGYKSFDDLAEEYDIPVYYVNKYSMKDKKDISFFKEHKFDLLIQGVWQRLFPKEVLDSLIIGAIGVHGSSEFLPKGRGRSPINWSLIEGRKRFIIHYFLLKPGIDDGDIFKYEIFDINEWDTCRTLYLKNTIITRIVLLKWIPRLLENNFKLIPQYGEPTYYPKRTPEDGKIDWKCTVFEIYNFIRALTKPYPGAFAFIDTQKVLIWKAQPFDTRIVYPKAHVGEIVETFSSGDIVVKCNSGLLLMTEYDAELHVGQVFE